MRGETVDDSVAQTAETNKKIKRLKRGLYALLAVFAILLLALIYYLVTQRPVTKVLPGVPKSAPRYVKSVYGDFGTLSGVAVNKSGTRFYAVDTSKQKVWIISEAGAVVGSFGSTAEEGKEEGFAAPLFVAVGASDEIYVADRLKAQISVYSPLGKFIKRFVPQVKGPFIWSPLAIATDMKGNVYVTDAAKGEHRVLVFDKQGKLLRKFGSEGSKKGQFSYPNGIAVADDGKIYVADSNNARVQVFSNTGKSLKTITGTGAGSLTHPVGIDVSRSGEIHVVESLGHTVNVFDTDGTYLYSFGELGIMDGQFRYPQGIAINGNGRVIVADRDNTRLQIWQY